MKKILFFSTLATALLLFCAAPTFAQCPDDNTDSGLNFGALPSMLTYDAGEYAIISVTAGTFYNFSTCGAAAWDTRLTLYEDGTGILLATNDDFCGLQSLVSWTATLTGNVRVLLDQFPCSHSGQTATVSVDSNNPPNTIFDDGSTILWLPNSSTQGSMNWSLEPGGLDQSFQMWYWYRIDGEPNETSFGTPTTESYVDNVATLTFNNVDGKNFDAVITMILTDGPGNQAQILTDIAITNNTGAPLDIEVFNYFDLDKSGTSSSETAELVAQNTIEITDTGGGGDVCEYKAFGADAFQSLNFSGLRSLLDDGGLTNLDNSGLPFGPGDWTGAYQWSLNINPGSTRSALSGVGGNQALVANTGAIPTMGEWGLIILALLVLSFGTVFMMRRQVAFAGAGNFNVSANSGIPFDKNSFVKLLVGVIASLVVLFAISVSVFGYEMTNADIPGSLIAAPIAAYLLHLLVAKK